MDTPSENKEAHIQIKKAFDDRLRLKTCSFCKNDIPKIVLQDYTSTFTIPCLQCKHSIWHRKCYNEFILEKKDNTCPTCKNPTYIGESYSNLFQNYEKLKHKTSTISKCKFLCYPAVLIIIFLFVVVLYLIFKEISVIYNTHAYKYITNNLVNNNDTIYGICFLTLFDTNTPWIFDNYTEKWCMQEPEKNVFNLLNSDDIILPNFHFIVPTPTNSPFMSKFDWILILITSILLFSIYSIVHYGLKTQKIEDKETNSTTTEKSIPKPLKKEKIKSKKEPEYKKPQYTTKKVDLEKVAFLVDQVQTDRRSRNVDVVITAGDIYQDEEIQLTDVKDNSSDSDDSESSDCEKNQEVIF